MIDLIFWSFVLGLTPWALGLGWRLIAGSEEASKEFCSGRRTETL